MNRILQFAQVALLSASAMGAATLVTYPIPTNLENIAVRANGNLFVTGSVLDGIIYQISPVGFSQVFGQVPDFAGGAAFDTSGNLIVASRTSFNQCRQQARRQQRRRANSRHHNKAPKGSSIIAIASGNTVAAFVKRNRP